MIDATDSRNLGDTLTRHKPTNLNYVQTESSNVRCVALLDRPVSCLSFARPCGGGSSSISRTNVKICARWRACGALPGMAGLPGKPAAPAGRKSIPAPSENSRERHVPPVRSGLPHASRLHPAMRWKPVGQIAHLIGDDMATGKNEVLEPARLIRDVQERHTRFFRCATTLPHISNVRHLASLAPLHCLGKPARGRHHSSGSRPTGCLLYTSPSPRD